MDMINLPTGQPLALMSNSSFRSRLEIKAIGEGCCKESCVTSEAAYYNDTVGANKTKPKKTYKVDNIVICSLKCHRLTTYRVTCFPVILQGTCRRSWRGRTNSYLVATCTV